MDYSEHNNKVEGLSFKLNFIVLCTAPNLDEDELAELFLNTNWCKYFEDNFQPLSKDGIYKASFEKEKNISTNEMLLNL